ncbi:MAG: hypothetical protein KC656_09780 [Myxococcales bacterium]|nr:hypothetical protein [Myxococcales bacterium]MCB9669588.1 hypothetical protein [Alphaproteobacteria bacterium]
MTKSMLNNVARSALVGLLAGVVAATPAFAGDTDGETTESNGCSAKDGCNQTASEGEESCQAKDDTTTADTQPSSEGGESCKAAEECKAKDDTTAASAEGDDKKKKKEKKKKDKKKKDKPAA